MEVPHYLRDWVSTEEIYEALVSGTRPVYFQETETSFMWGSGTLFLIGFAGHEFALTAKHVFTKVGADPQQTRILFSGSQVALPLAGAWFPQFPGEESQEDLEDMFLLEIDQAHPAREHAEAPELLLWRFNDFWVPAWLLDEGEQVFAVGFPSTDDRFDYDNSKIRETAMVAIGKLRKGNGKGLFRIECAEFEMNIAGSSGGPVFARLKGYFMFIGMMIRGGTAAPTIHFVDAQYVRYMLVNAVSGIEARRVKKDENL